MKFMVQNLFIVRDTKIMSLQNSPWLFGTDIEIKILVFPSLEAATKHN